MAQSDGVYVSGPGIKALERKIAAMDKAARGGLQRELEAGLVAGATPIVPKVRVAARANLPRRGGLAAEVAARPMRVEVSHRRDPAVLLIVEGSEAIATNAGRLRHPVFGNLDNWVTQAIRPGWFSEVMQKEAPKVRPDLERAMRRVADKIERA